VAKHHCSGDLTSFRTMNTLTTFVYVNIGHGISLYTYSSIPLRYPPLDMNLKAKQIHGWWDSVSSIAVLASIEA